MPFIKEMNAWDDSPGIRKELVRAVFEIVCLFELCQLDLESRRVSLCSFFWTLLNRKQSLISVNTYTYGWP
jgi:hypothetical protein